MRRCDCYAHLKRLSDQKGNNELKLINFFKRKTMIGKSSKCDVRFDGSDYPMAILKVHASFEMLDTGITVKDLSTNGVFVNNEKISMKILRDGDVVIFGNGKIIKKFEKPIPSIGCDEESVLTSTSECCLYTVSEDIGRYGVEMDKLKETLSCPVCKNLIVIPTPMNVDILNVFNGNRKVYGEVIVSKLLKEIREWTESEKDEVKALFKKAKGKEREYWATTLGFSKAELMRMKEKEIEMMLENLRISCEKRREPKDKNNKIVFIY
ncbi:FHA domain containing protein [Entamoeba marina]